MKISGKALAIVLLFVGLVLINYLASSIPFRADATAELSAERAEQFGLVSEVVPAKSLDSAVEKLCAQILKAPHAAVLAIKEYARVAPSMDIRGAIDYARSLHAVVNSSSEMRPEPRT